MSTTRPRAAGNPRAAAGGRNVRAGDGRWLPRHLRPRRGPGSAVRGKRRDGLRDSGAVRAGDSAEYFGPADGPVHVRGVSVRQQKSRQEHLTGLKDETRTMIFYEAPHKLLATLRDLADAFGEDRKISLCRELTKLHEEVRRMTLGEAAAYYEETPPRGEFVLVVAGAEEKRTRAAHLKPPLSWFTRAWRRVCPRRTLSSRSRS